MNLRVTTRVSVNHDKIENNMTIITQLCSYQTHNYSLQQIVLNSTILHNVYIGREAKTFLNHSIKLSVILGFSYEFSTSLLYINIPTFKESMKENLNNKLMKKANK
jgi:hypothetical protein